MRKGRRIPGRLIDLPTVRRNLFGADIDEDPSGIGLDIKTVIDISYGRLGVGVAVTEDPPSNASSSSPDPQQTQLEPQSPPPSPRRRHNAGSQNDDVLPPLIGRPSQFFK